MVVPRLLLRMVVVQGLETLLETALAKLALLFLLLSISRIVQLLRIIFISLQKKINEVESVAFLCELWFEFRKAKNFLIFF
jgi:hypothetical protein